jgi:hypothetical protein
MRNSAKTNNASNIANIRRNLSFSATRRCFSFRHLGAAGTMTAEGRTKRDRMLPREADAADGVIDLRPERNAARDSCRKSGLASADPRTIGPGGASRPRTLGCWPLTRSRACESLAKDGATCAPSSWVLERERYGKSVIDRLIARGSIRKMLRANLGRRGIDPD